MARVERKRRVSLGTSDSFIEVCSLDRRASRFRFSRETESDAPIDADLASKLDQAFRATH